jgi:hypothetical protein
LLFGITNWVAHIENTSYVVSISGKVADFISESIEALIRKGYDDAARIVEGLIPHSKEQNDLWIMEMHGH